MRCDQLPLTGFLHPYVGKSIVVIVSFLAVQSFFMVYASDDGGVAMHPHPHLVYLGGFNAGATARTISEVAGFAVGASIFKCDHEIVVEHRGKNLYLMVFVAFQELEFQGLDGSRGGGILRP